MKVLHDTNNDNVWTLTSWIMIKLLTGHSSWWRSNHKWWEWEWQSSITFTPHIFLWWSRRITGGFRFVMGVPPFLVVMDDLIARPKVWPSSCRSSTAAFRSDAWDVSWANHRSFNEFQWVSCGFMAFHRKKPDEFLFWMAYDGVFVLKQTLSKHVKHQMPAQDWDRQPEVDSAHLMSPQTHIAAAKWMIQEFIDDLWIINL